MLKFRVLVGVVLAYVVSWCECGEVDWLLDNG